MTSEAKIGTDDSGRICINTIGMQPPGPFVAVMGWIETNPGASEVIVRLERDPVYLFPELVEAGWDWQYLTESDGLVELLLRKSAE